MTQSTSKEQLAALSHNQRERLTYLEFCLYFLGEFRRADLMARFSIASAVATRDIGQYKLLAEQNLELHQSSKAYRITKQFTPVFEHRLEQVMGALMQGEGYGVEGSGEAMLPCEYPSILNRPQLPILGAVTRAIRAQKLLRIRYHSATSGEQERVIAPFAIVDSGLRWHIRAYDRLRERFIDLVITRIVNAEVLDDYPKKNELPTADIQWNRVVELELVPHPAHNDAAIAELDYGMANGVLNVQVRAANAGYMLRRWFVDCSPNHALQDEACRLWLRNGIALYGVESAKLAPGYVSP